MKWQMQKCKLKMKIGDCKIPLRYASQIFSSCFIYIS